MYADDRARAQAFAEGDEMAFVALYNRHKDAIYAFCLKMLSDPQRAQDAMQDTFLRAYENRDRLPQLRSVRAWLFTVARNGCLNQMRKGRRLVELDLDDGWDEPIAPADVPSGQLEKSEEVELVNTFLQQLPPHYREVLVLREYQNLSYDEIAAVTRSTLSAVKSRLFKARKKLAAYLEPVLRGDAPPKTARTSKTPSA